MKFLKHLISGDANIQISGSNITINGQTIDTDNINMNKPDLVIRLESDSIFDLEVKTDKLLSINGDIRGNVNCRGNINCDDVGGLLNAGGNVNCDDVHGNVEAGGNVNCDSVKGGVKAGGNINCRG